MDARARRFSSKLKLTFDLLHQVASNVKMNTATSRRAGARLVACLTSPATRSVDRSSYRQTLQPHNLRFASSTPRRWQSTPAKTTSPSPSRPSQTPLPTKATQNSSPQTTQNTIPAAEKVQHELSPSDESDPLRALDETPAVLDPNSGDQIDWTRSFQGLSSSPFTPEQATILQQEIPFDDIEIKPDGIIYLPEIKYRRILNRTFGPGGWGLAPRGETIVTDKLVTREYGLVAGGRLISIARGEQQYFDASGIPTATEGCKSNALMRCCKDLGIASELWDPRFIKRYMKEMGRETVVEHATTKKRRKHFMRKDDEIKYPFKEVAVGGSAGGTGARR